MNVWKISWVVSFKMKLLQIKCCKQASSLKIHLKLKHTDIKLILLCTEFYAHK